MSRQLMIPDLERAKIVLKDQGSNRCSEELASWLLLLLLVFLTALVRACVHRGLEIPKREAILWKKEANY